MELMERRYEVDSMRKTALHRFCNGSWKIKSIFITGCLFITTSVPESKMF